MIRKLLAAALLLGAAAPALAVAPVAPPAAAPAAAIPAQLDAAARDNYRAVFAAMRAGDWSSAAARLDALPDGLLTPFARAELYLAKGSPAIEAEPLVALLNQATDLPQAARLAALARKRGVESVPTLPYENELKRMSGAPRRQSARSIKSDAIAMTLSAQVVPLIKDDRPSEAETLLLAVENQLCAEAQTEWQQRIAWSYFLTGDDVSARRLADRARTGMGEWAVQADWVAGLAAWRQKDYAAASQAFTAVSSRARDTEMTAAGLFWAARADLAAGQPEKVQARLRSASRLPETFYGLLAGGALGQALPPQAAAPAFREADWSALSTRRNIRVAAALSEIGENALADTTLRHQARIGAMRDHEALLHLAARLNLPSAQIWLAQNGPAGASMSAGARYPAPSWTPRSGWRVDKSLVFAHALQESQFRADAVSPAGARGLLQVLPGTAQLIDRHRGSSFGSNLSDPTVNIEYGQAYMEELRDGGGTGGLLPKVIAAYNAGPGSVMKWNDRRRDGGDPLLFIESIPFAETRGYVAIVLRNYWMYQRGAGVKSDSLRAIAQGMWPRFPGLPGRTAVRLDSIGGIAAAD
ncbi:lytic transglycosylase domain-containing protein [Sphingomonas solaris]|uniref:Lytic transglycosylase domain-containing protein n=1 Tax=Alterirhizorhabdus solaris TaxID=2529389 RepID=A0A558R890_9SPHN|nr:lytic transglycosylase domain-containing protein [Sphingomonas solaris]TVV75611.1 lytic transglycosylase domain-containing protein [Sphingomonas solaris]